VTLLTLQKQRGNLFSIDVDHMSLNSQAPPENHKAVGWFTIEARHGDLWAVNVEWTDDVRAGLAKDPPEWRYFSPAYDTKRDSGEIVRLLNIAVTNNPATWNVTALAGATGEEHRVAAAAAAHSFDFAEDEERHYAIMYWAPRDGAIGH
jgi:phage I-like protein